MSDYAGKQQIKMQADWWSKTLAGIFLGLLLSYGLIALFAWFGPDNVNQTISNERVLWRVQFNMWLVAPIWMCVLSLVYLFRSGKQAWLKLGLANLVIYGVWMALRSAL